MALQHNNRGTTLRFGRHRRSFMQMQLPSASLVLADCRLVEYFFTLYFFYFAAFQEFTMLQSPNRMLWTNAAQLEIN